VNFLKYCDRDHTFGEISAHKENCQAKNRKKIKESFAMSSRSVGH
jgi:hypothetical protein